MIDRKIKKIQEIKYVSKQKERMKRKRLGEKHDEV